MAIQRVCVFCGSSPGARPEYAEAARALAKYLVKKNIAIVYGGGHVGLMGILSDTARSEGGEVIGVSVIRWGVVGALIHQPASIRTPQR